MVQMMELLTNASLRPRRLEESEHLQDDDDHHDGADEIEDVVAPAHVPYLLSAALQGRTHTRRASAQPAGDTYETQERSSLATAQQLLDVLDGKEPFHRVV